MAEAFDIVFKPTEAPPFYNSDIVLKANSLGQQNWPENDEIRVFILNNTGWNDFIYVDIGPWRVKTSNKYLYKSIQEDNQFVCQNISGLRYASNLSSIGVGIPVPSVFLHKENGFAFFFGDTPSYYPQHQSFEYLLIEVTDKAGVKENLDLGFEVLDNYLENFIDYSKVRLDKVILEKELKAKLIEEIEEFIASKEYYRRELRIPWKRGLLLYGPPGNGKTMFLKAIKSHFDLNLADIRDFIYHGTISIDNPPSDQVKPTLLVIEDIDKMFPSDQNQDIVSCSLQELLNALDGVRALDGFLVIATANNVRQEGISEALFKRPGRFDSLYKFSGPTVDQIKAYFEAYDFSLNSEEALDELTEGLLGTSMAFVMRLVVDLKTKFRENVIEKDIAFKYLEKIKTHYTKEDITSYRL